MLRCYRENTLRTDVPYLLIRKMSLTRGTIQIELVSMDGGIVGRGMERMLEKPVQGETLLECV